MDYSKLSDLDIAILVGKHFPEDVIVSEDYAYRLIPCAASAYTGIDYEEVDFDPCNNVYDAWKIIVESNIALCPYRYTLPTAWPTSFGMNSRFTVENKNILRAAMIVFLMLKESGTVSKRMLDNLNDTAKNEDFNTYE